MFYFKLKYTYVIPSPSPPLKLSHVLPTPSQIHASYFLIAIITHIHELTYKYNLLSPFSVTCRSSYYVNDILV